MRLMYQTHLIFKELFIMISVDAEIIRDYSSANVLEKCVNIRLALNNHWIIEVKIGSSTVVFNPALPVAPQEIET